MSLSGGSSDILPPAPRPLIFLSFLATLGKKTLHHAKRATQSGFRAAKFGWGRIGLSTVRDDADQFMAAREGLGTDGILLVDIKVVL